MNCPKCCRPFYSEKKSEGGIIAWCSECEHTYCVMDMGSDPIQLLFDKMAGIE